MLTSSSIVRSLSWRKSRRSSPREQQQAEQHAVNDIHTIEVYKVCCNHVHCAPDANDCV